MINFNEAVNISNTHVLALVPELFHLEGYNIHIIPPHEGGRNVVYTCEQEGRESLILRVSFLPDRKREDYIAELEYVRYLFEHGASVSNVVSSKKGHLLEEITYDEHTFFICMFVKGSHLPNTIIIAAKFWEKCISYRKGTLPSIAGII